MGIRRRRYVAAGIVAVTTFVACTFSTTVSNVTPDGTPDAGACLTAPSQECVDGTMLRVCTTQGLPPDDVPCGWGCVTDGEHHCGVIAPAGGAVQVDDMRPGMFGTVGDVVLGAASTMDGSAGTISGVTTGFTHEVRGRVAVFRVRSLTVNAPLELVGPFAIAIIADGPITINAVVDAKGPCGSNDAAATPGPGGFAGGITATDNGLGSGGGKVGSGSSGGGGGGNGTAGAAGGIGPAAQPGGAGGDPAGTVTIDELIGGGGGGATAGGGGRGRGGGGGGAVQLVSNTKIVLMSGGIDAGGCGGDSGQGGGDDGGGGGGAGGTILLEAPIVEGTGALAVNGGGGGAGDDATDDRGKQATLDRVHAEGARSTATGEAGGDGAAGTTTPTKGNNAMAGTHAGGGGGGIGRIRFNTLSGDVAATGVMSPALQDANSTCTAGSANVQ